MVKNRWFMRTRDASLRQQNVPGVLEQQFWIATGAEAGAMTPMSSICLTAIACPS
jgi:hypothetical protein